MPRGKRRKAHELTSDEAMERLFSKTVVKRLKKVANPDEHKEKKAIDGE
ncbi:MAG: hypothetical protein ACYDA3_06900 [Gaiellaceae bacterium]